MKILKNKKAMVVAVLLVALSGWIASYIWLVNSEVWRFTKSYISSSEELRSRVCQVTEVGLSPFGFQYRFVGEYAEAILTSDVIGKCGDVRVTIKVERSNGRWLVKSIAY